MDHESLRTAATYLNNLLLARGLLRHGAPIDFVKPSRESRAQIINLVHDLVLREDGEKERRERTALTLRDLRADGARHAAAAARLEERNEEAGRALAQARAGERAAQAAVAKGEAALKRVQEQAARLRAGLAQVKTQCVNDVRKRDLELARLKTHLQGQQRGNRAAGTAAGAAPAAPSITISGGAPPGAGKRAWDASVHGLDDPAYSLKQETTEFLTQLGQSLSDENDGLIGLIRGALATMRGLLGLAAMARDHPDSAVGSLDGDADKPHPGGMLHAVPTSYETLAADMEATLAHLKTVLSNPNFVSIEEVEVRDEEIARLREGWERMEQRWKDVLLMMEGWRRKMDTGDTINIEDLRRGMGLVSPDRPPHGGPAAEPEQSFVSEDSEIRVPDDDPDESSILLEPPRLSSLVATGPPKRKRDLLEPPESFDLRPAGLKSGPKLPGHPLPQLPSGGEEDEGFMLDGGSDDGEDEGEGEGDRRLTVAEKLSAAQAEAEEATAARAAATAKSPEKSSTRDAETGLGSMDPAAADGRGKVSLGALKDAADGEDGDTLGRMPSPVVKRAKIRGRPRRRKSTLSPEELEALIAMDADEGV